jgi:hypothetical protein
MRVSSEDTILATHNCPLCGNEAAAGNRYCRECDVSGEYTASRASERRRTAAPPRAGNVPLVLLFFVVSAFGTVMAGVFAPSALSIPLLTGTATPAATREWGVVRVTRVTARIRVGASTGSKAVGKLAIGDSVRVEPIPGGWYRVFEAPLVPRLKAKPLGFVYGTLLAPVAQADAGSGGR